MYRIFTTFIFITIVSLLLYGCSLNENLGVQKEQVAECPVCKVNNDLGCMNVRVKGDTPKIEYNGRIFYFCSEECKKGFVKHPELYNQRSQLDGLLSD